MARWARCFAVGNIGVPCARLGGAGKIVVRRFILKADPPIFIGKWTVQILFALHQAPHRHAQLQRRLSHASQRMLTRTLRNLQSTGLIARNSTGSSGRGVEYSLTELGKTFITPLTSMCRWARQNRKAISAEIRLTEVST